jgi:hypothetical protein
MPNSLLEISKVSFWEEFLSQIYNSYDVRSKQNGLLMIYRIYLKSFMILSDLYMCCFGFTKFLGTQTSNKLSAGCHAYVSACMRARTRSLATSRPTSTWRVPHGRCRFRPCEGKTEPLLYRSLSPSISSFFSPARTFSSAWPSATSDAGRTVHD